MIEQDHYSLVEHPLFIPEVEPHPEHCATRLSLIFNLIYHHHSDFLSKKSSKLFQLVYDSRSDMRSDLRLIGLAAADMRSATVIGCFGGI